MLLIHIIFCAEVIVWINRETLIVYYKLVRNFIRIFYRKLRGETQGGGGIVFWFYVAVLLIQKSLSALYKTMQQSE